ncbi:MAG: oligoendopeptidase F [Alkalicoccus sp.]|nr:MAG: oligoendopeptidase F [Alkalicoccus sp.]
MDTSLKTRIRKDIPAEETWNLEDLFDSRESWTQAEKEIEHKLEEIAAWKGKVAESASALLQSLEARDRLQEAVMRFASFANLKETADGTNPDNQKDSARAAGLGARVEKGTAFIPSEIMEMPAERIELFIREEPGLEDFRRILMRILEKKPHRLSSETEEVLAAFGEVHKAPYMIFERSRTSDMRFPAFQTSDGKEHDLTFNNFSNYETSPDTELRRKAYETFTGVLQQYKNTYAAALSVEIRKQVIESRLRGYSSVTTMLLDEQQVTPEMYHRQLDTIQETIAPHMRRFAALKKRMLGLDKMTFSDLKAPLDPEFDPGTTYEEAGEMILEALKVMGPEYMEVMKDGLENRWVDRADNVGKRSGAFCASPYGVHPYILMTWSDAMRNAFTLAHELGHAGHFRLAGQCQRISSTRASLYFIEAPSTMNEMLLSRHILQNSEDERMHRWVILQSLGTYYHNFVTHILEGELQRRIYEAADQDIPVTAELLTEEKQKVLQDFWGEDVEIDDGAGLTWMRQPHYYMGLYPYTYSAGLTASTAAAGKIIEEGQPAVDRWIQALKDGGTKTPLELMQTAGVDMSTDEPIREAAAYVGHLVDELIKSCE